MFKNIYKYYSKFVTDIALTNLREAKAMPLSKAHKAASRRRIVDAARELFNLNGFKHVSIEDIMARAGLTRGGFYAHFKNKAALYAEAIRSIRVRHQENGLEQRCQENPRAVQKAVAEYYLSGQHRDNPEGGCPLPALVSDVSREDETVKEAYTEVFQALANALSGCNPNQKPSDEQLHSAIVAAVLAVGGQIISRAVTDPNLSDKILKSCREEILNR
ncbi:MAG: TetR/AcrR family transcriptional regulator [Alphaproteobacteria bacterium]|nr:TetR/AcrR family transcriptional regulator [Alphaproteobacteria bacterium]